MPWVSRRVARQAGASVFVSASLAAACLGVLLERDMFPSYSLEAFLMGSAALISSATLCSVWLSQRFLGARLRHLVRVIDRTGPDADLARIKALGNDEIGAIGQAINRLLARLTSIRASMIDQERELGEAQRELVLKADLAAKTAELSQRLDERAMLFEIMRVTSSSPELSVVLSTLVDRVGQLMHMRETVLFLYDEEARAFSVQAAYGLANVEALKGRTLQRGEGISGKVGDSLDTLYVSDLSVVEDYQGFWGHAERTGSLAAVPLLYQQKLLGVLTVTRAEREAISDVHLNLLRAVADNAALAIRNAQLFERMRELSTHDELTGLANRRLLRTHLEREIDRARRFGQPFSMLALDIDHFKHLNDKHGHPAGDAALRELSSLLSEHVRKVDSVARVGGEEFMVLLPRTNGPDAAGVADKLRAAVRAFEFLGGADQPAGALTVSIGVAELAPDDDERGESVIGRADQALYEAKRAGRNRAVLRAR